VRAKGAAAVAFALAAAGDAVAAPDAIDPVVFFTGASHAEGRLREAFKRERRVSTDSVGRAEKDGLLVLDQKMSIEGEPLRIRHWRLRQVAPNHFAGTLTDAKGKSGRYTAAGAAQVAGAPFKGTGRFDDYDCTFEARRIQ